MKDYLLSHGKLVGWSPGNYGGFPVFIYYFPLLFLIGALLSFFLPIMVAFKIISILGALLLPVATYTMLRLMRLKYPAPALGAIASLVILFNESHTMWGGNFLSNYAGEFTYAFSFALTFVFLGFMFRAKRDMGHVVIGALLLALIITSHGFTFIICVLSSVFFLLNRKNFINHLAFIASVFGLGVMLVAVWFFQLYFDSPFITEYNLIWTFGDLSEIFPKMLWPFQAVFIAFTGWILYDRITKKNKISADWLAFYSYAWFILVICVIAFFSAETLKLPDIRFIPFAHYISVVFGAAAIAWILKEGSYQVAVPFVGFFLMLIWLAQFPSQALGWARYNYLGIESTTNWPTFKRINEDIKGNYSDPRVVYEHGANNQTMGTPRAFESIPLFSGRATLEGLYFQSSMLSTSVFYLQSLYSKEISCPFPDYPCTTMSYERAHSYLELFNVSEMIVFSQVTKKAISEWSSLYEKKKSYPESGYEIWKLKRSKTGYVEVLAEEPESVGWSDIRYKSYQWLRNYQKGSRFLISKPELKFSVYSLSHIPFPRQTQKQASSKNCLVKKERIEQESIQFETSCLNQAHLLKIAYHPGWEVKGAEGPYYVSPGMMVVYPTSNQVELQFTNRAPVVAGKIASVLGLMILLILGIFFGKKSFDIQLPKILSLSLHRGFLAVCVLVLVFLIKHLGEPGFQRSFKYAEVFYTARDYKTAQKMFTSVIEKWSAEPSVDKVHYYLALSYLLNGESKEASQAFRKMYKFRDSEYLAEAHYHVGLLAKNENDCRTALKEFQFVTNELKHPRWGEYAKEKANECRASY